MKIIEKDILTVERGIIVHQVNCQGVMGSGIAKAIRNKWPVVYEDYRIFCIDNGPPEKLLGQISFTAVNDANTLFVCNLFGQLRYGYDKAKYTVDEAFETGLKELAAYECEKFFPFKIGCERGGGDWNYISGLIEKYIPDATICKLPVR